MLGDPSNPLRKRHTFADRLYFLHFRVIIFVSSLCNPVSPYKALKAETNSLCSLGTGDGTVIRVGQISEEGICNLNLVQMFSAGFYFSNYYFVEEILNISFMVLGDWPKNVILDAISYSIQPKGKSWLTNTASWKL